MGENSKIEWTDHTFNPWVGCTKISPACDHCYAESWAKRTGSAHLWQGERRLTSHANWKQPLKWDREAEAAGIRRRVFCASLADVFDNQVPDEWRADLWRLIEMTPNLDWLLLTKRPQNAGRMIVAARRDVLGADVEEKHLSWPWPNVWLGATVENQEEADRRIPHLLATPAAVRFLSCEPLLGQVDLTRIRRRPDRTLNALNGLELHCMYDGGAGVQQHPRIDWLIAGGESGPGARPAHPDWFRSLRDQCAAAGVAFHFKQWGEWAPHKPMPGGDLGGDVRAGRVRIVHPTGQSDVEVSIATGGRNTIPGSRYMARVGKKRAGRLLDGRTHDEFPAVRP